MAKEYDIHPHRVIVAVQWDFNEVSSERADERRQDLVRRLTLNLPEGAKLQSRVAVVNGATVERVASDRDRVVQTAVVERPALPTQAVARKTDPETSHEAAWTVKGMRKSQAAVLDCFHRHGAMTDQQLIDRYHDGVERYGWPWQSESGLRTRRKELVRSWYLEDSGHRDKLPSGRASIVWDILEDE